jgi:uncharacterized repeat protein (TIGR01451 family)
MTKLHRLSGIILLALIFTVGIGCAAETDVNLSLTKVVSSTAPYETGQPISWFITLTNNGPAVATNISVAEDLSGFSGPVDTSGTADVGIYNNASGIWNISELANATSAHLTIVTLFTTAGQQTNKVDISDLDQTNQGDTHVQAVIPVINNGGAAIPDQPLTVNLVIRPNTLNLGSRGVFTVFVTLNSGDSLFPTGRAGKPGIDFGNSSLSCGGAEMVSAGVSDKDGGTLIAKFHRQDLENVTGGSGVQINCSGTFSVNGKMVDIEGSDTIRVIGEKKGLDKFISGLMRYLGLERDDVLVNETEDGNVAVSFTLNPDSLKNNGQVKKALRTQDPASSDTGNVRNVADNSSGPQKNTPKNNGNGKNNNGKDTSIQGNNAGTNPDNGNKNADKGNDASNGKSNGKKNK